MRDNLNANDVETLWAIDGLYDPAKGYTTASNADLLGFIDGITSHSAVSRRITRLKQLGLVDVAYANDIGRSRRYITLTDPGLQALDIIAEKFSRA